MNAERAIAQRVSRRVRIAINDLLRGFAHEEVVFLNRVSASFRKRPSCEIPGPPSVSADSDWQPLHRRGPRGRDLLGSDVAVSVVISPPGRLKTAFFQLKVSDSYRAEVEEHQLRCAAITQLVADRSFVMHLNTATRDVRVAGIDYLRAKQSGSQPVAFRSDRWLSLEDWVTEWLRCRVGPVSKPGDLAGPEALLDYYANNRVPHFGFEHAEDDPQLREALSHVPPSFLPARAWLTSVIEITG